MGDSMSRNQSSLDELLTTLPACRRCRLNKRRCDPNVPSCQNCSKAGVECIFYDHVRKEDVSRSYVASLITELQQAPATGGSAQSANSTAPAATISAPKASRYIGSRACLAYSPSSDGWTACSTDQQVFDPQPPFLRTEYGIEITPEVHKFLLDEYVSHVHRMYPFLDPARPPFTLASNTRASSSWEQFMLQSVYATACLCVNRDGYRRLADECHVRAIGHLDQATADGSTASLQAITLLALHSFFQPQQGNTSQLIGFAARLAMDIERHGDQEQQMIAQEIYPSIYSLENKLITALDRPGLFPEPTGPLEFNASSPSDLVCSLYRIQSRFRNSDQNATTLLGQNVRIDSPGWRSSENSLHPNVLAVVYETYLLINPTSTTACRLLSCYTRARYKPTFLTPHWAYKAGLILFGNGPNSIENENTHITQAFSDCTLVLERCSQQWPSSKLLKRAVESFLHRVDAGVPDLAPA